MNDRLSEGYRQVVGDQAVELERRMREADAKIELAPCGAGWSAKLTVTGGRGRSMHRRAFVAEAPMLATALWLAACLAGLTDGLNPPPRST